MSKDYYKTLGVGKEADANELKSAFRSLSKQHHPDVGGDEEKFKEINDAYSVLSNPQKRQEYDNPSPFGDSGGFPFGFSPFGFSNRRRPDPTAPRPGGSIELLKEIPLHIFIFGGDIKTQLSYDDFCKKCGGKGAAETEQCGDCNGSGMVSRVQTAQGMQIHTQSPCSKCNGRGWTSVKDCEVCAGSGKTKIENRVVDVFVPFGIRDGHVLVKPGEGRSGFNGGPPGNLIIKLIMKLPKKDELTEEQIKVLEEL